MDLIDIKCQKCRKQIRIVRGMPALCRACAGPDQDKTAESRFFHKGTLIIAPDRKKNDKP